MSLSAFQIAMNKKREERENVQEKAPEATKTAEEQKVSPQGTPQRGGPEASAGATGHTGAGAAPVGGKAQGSGSAGGIGNLRTLGNGNAGRTAPDENRDAAESGGSAVTSAGGGESSSAGHEGGQPAAGASKAGGSGTQRASKIVGAIGGTAGLSAAVAAAAKGAKAVAAPATTTPVPAPRQVKKIGIAGLKKLGSPALTPAATGEARPPVAGTKPATQGGLNKISLPAKPAGAKPTTPQVPAGSALGKLMERAAPVGEAGLNDPAYRSDISLEAQLVLDEGDAYQVDELLQNWPAVEDDDEETADELQEVRNSLVARAVARLNTLFKDHLEALKVGDAGHPVCLELSQITKLTFMRVKNSPAAWDALDKDDHAIIVRSLRVMAEKRTAATKGAKNKKAASKELEAAGQFEDMFADMDMAGIDLGFGV